MRTGYFDMLEEGKPPLSPDTPTPLPPSDRHLWQITPIRDLLWVGSIVCVLWFGYYLRGVFSPVLVALLLAYLFNPLIRRAEIEWKFPRPLTISLVLFLSALTLGGLVTWLGPLLAEQVQSFAERAPQYLQSIASTVPCSSRGFLRTHLDDRHQPQGRSALDSEADFFRHRTGVRRVGTVIGTTADVVLALDVDPDLFLFLCLAFRQWLARLKRYIPARYRPTSAEIGNGWTMRSADFFRGRMTIALRVSHPVFLGWALTGIRYWFYPWADNRNSHHHSLRLA